MRFVGLASMVLMLGIACIADVVAFGETAAQAGNGAVDFDPLRHYLPGDDLYMPVPGGVVAVTDGAGEEATIEEQAARRDGGMIVGYCLRASCRRVTHLAVMQVCSNRIGGPDDANRLVLAVVRLPYGKSPGFLKSLQGRDYARNFAAYGMFEQPLAVGSAEAVEALYALSADGMGPVAEIDYLEHRPKRTQRHETLALSMTMLQNAKGIPFPRFEVRHLCQQPVS